MLQNCKLVQNNEHPLSSDAQREVQVDTPSAPPAVLNKKTAAGKQAYRQNHFASYQVKLAFDHMYFPLIVRKSIEREH